MPAYHVERTVRIDAPQDKVRPAVEDFNLWPVWSPWLCMERSAKLDVFGTPGQVGHGYDWDGDLVGAGGMKLAENSGGELKMDLHFLRPFKSKADVKFEIKPAGESATDVTWHMDGSMPFFLFWMIPMMKSMIGMDYERGLKMMKELVETGEVKSNIEIVGVVDVPQMHYVAVEASCTMDEIGDSMKQTMPAAHKLATDNNLEVAGPPGSLYHDVNLKEGHCRYSAYVPVKSPASVDGASEIQACKALKVVHTGSYPNVGNGWSTAMNYQRYKKLKPSKTQCPFEIYTNDPCETPEAELITEIYVPVRG